MSRAKPFFVFQLRPADTQSWNIDFWLTFTYFYNVFLFHDETYDDDDDDDGDDDAEDDDYVMTFM